jgi:hypothetical protein
VLASAARVHCGGISVACPTGRLERHGLRMWRESVRWCGWWRARTVEGRRGPCKAQAALLCFCSSPKKKQRGR